MADVVGSGEGAEAAGEDVGRETGRDIAGAAGDSADAQASSPEQASGGEAGGGGQAGAAQGPGGAVGEDASSVGENDAAVEDGAGAEEGAEAGENPAEGSAGAQEAAEPAVEASAETVVVPAQAPVAAAPAAPAGPVPAAIAASFVEAPAASAGSSAQAPSGGAFTRLGLVRRKALVIGGAVVVVAGAAAAAIAASGGSGSGKDTAGALGDGSGAGAMGSASANTPAKVPPPIVTTVPADGATGVDPSKPVTVQVKGGTIASVQLSGQDQTNGTLSTDSTSWTSDNVLSVNSGYHLTITAKNSAGATTTRTVSFQTLKPSATFGVDSVVPPRGSTVGVGQPIRVAFTNYVPQEYKAALEKACVVTTEPPVAGAWYWVSNGSNGAVVDWRPENFWAVNTKVSIAFNLDGVRLGEHQFGVKNYAAHKFSISDRDLRLEVDKDKFRATCYENGQVIRTFPIDTGVTTAETFVTYTGTMAVLGKGNPVEMKGNYGPNDTYDDFVNWATQITWSGTYVHAAPWDGEIGHANDDSHGCVHCRTSDAEWYYNKVIAGDVVTITGHRTRPVAVDNGICTFTLDWQKLLKGSAYGATINGKPVSA